MTKKSKTAPKKPAAPKATKEANPADGKMAKAQLVDHLAANTELTKRQSADVVDAFIDVIVEAVKRGKSVTLPGVGTLSVRPTAARTGVRPGTNEKIEIPAGKKLGFKVSTTLKGTF